MRRILILLLLPSGLFAGEMKSEKTLLNETQKKCAAMSKESLDKRKRSLEALEKAFTSALEELKRQSPEKAEPEEEKISLLFSTMKPVFKLGKSEVNSKTCDQTENQLRAENSLGRGETETLSPPSEQALKLLKALCGKN